MHVHFGRSCRGIAAAALLLVCAAAAPAQVTDATVKGRVVDASGDVLPGAVVTARHADTGVRRETTSDAAGTFLLAGLTPGVYTLGADVTGFRPFSKDGLRLTVGETADVTITLGLANVFRGRVRWMPLGVFGGTIAMNVVAVSTILGFYWGGPRSGLATRVRAVVAWAPMQGEVLVAGAVVGMVVAVCTASALGMVSMHREGARPTAPTTSPSSDTRMAAGITTPE